MHWITILQIIAALAVTTLGSWLFYRKFKDVYIVPGIMMMVWFLIGGGMYIAFMLLSDATWLLFAFPTLIFGMIVCAALMIISLIASLVVRIRKIKEKTS
ncbi:hypothetical protein ACE1TF_10175 [Geomicrobium sp. JSM 1781026]|uniref:hypothetical protein n=1 Tax=Geomicrobium sp. JSM 1781026 TaxID=3344580 RepID=UPI0035C01056